jgi:hypothetical protein
LAEAIDWARAVADLAAGELDETVTRMTLGCLLKTQEDMELVREKGLVLLWNA